MSRGPQVIKARAVVTLIRLIKETGLQIKEVAISRDGEIRLIMVGEAAGSSEKANPWDKYYENPPKLR